MRQRIIPFQKSRYNDRPKDEEVLLFIKTRRTFFTKKLTMISFVRLVIHVMYCSSYRVVLRMDM